MRRRDHRRARPWRQLHPIGNDHAVVIDRHRDRRDLHMSEYLARRRVSWAFKPDAIARLQERMGDQLDGVAISRCHEYLRWRAVDPTRNLEIRSDLGAQCWQAVHGGMNHVGWLHGAHTSRAEACPDLSRKRIQGRQAHLERQNRVWTKTRRSDAGIGLGHRARHKRSRFEAWRHNGAGLAAGLNVALRGQQRISRIDSASRQTQLFGQRSCRGNAVTGLQHPASDGAAKPIVDLPVKGCGRLRIQRRDVARLRDGHGPANSVNSLRAIGP